MKHGHPTNAEHDDIRMIVTLLQSPRNAASILHLSPYTKYVFPFEFSTKNSMSITLHTWPDETYDVCHNECLQKSIFFYILL